MVSKTETLKLQDGSEVDAEIHPIGYLLMNQLQDEFIKINSFTKRDDGAIEMGGDIKLFSLKNKLIEKGVKNVDVNQLSIEEGDRIYKKYFEKYVNLALGGGTSPKF